METKNTEVAKITEVQRRVLRACRRGRREVVGAEWRPITRLEQLGFVEIDMVVVVGIVGTRFWATITDAGRAFIQARDDKYSVRRK